MESSADAPYARCRSSASVPPLASVALLPGTSSTPFDDRVTPKLVKPVPFSPFKQGSLVRISALEETAAAKEESPGLEDPSRLRVSISLTKKVLRTGQESEPLYCARYAHRSF